MTKVSRKILVTPHCIALRNLDPKTFRTFFLLRPPCTCPTSREYQSQALSGPRRGRERTTAADDRPPLCPLPSPSVAEEDLRTLFANTGGTVKAFKFFQ